MPRSCFVFSFLIVFYKIYSSGILQQFAARGQSFLPNEQTVCTLHILGQDKHEEDLVHS